MASPPYGGARSPPHPPTLALPRQRPSLALPTSSASRKPSLASSITSSAHPLRQTSFPPPDSLEAQHAAAEDAKYAYSPSAEGSLLGDDFSDTEIQSAISGPAGGAFGGAFGFGESGDKKRKRGEKKARGRPPKFANTGGGRTGSLGHGVEGGKRGEASVAPGDGDADAEPSDDEDVGAGGGRVPLYAGGELNAAEIDEQHERQRVFYETVPQPHTERYDSYVRAKLRTADVRRLVNQTLSQSVPANVVLVVSAYTKMFAGMLVEGAREVQVEWEGVEEKCADGRENEAFKRLKREIVEAEVQEKDVDMLDSERQDEDSATAVKAEPTTPAQLQDIPNTTQTQTQDTTTTATLNHPPSGGAQGLSRFIKEPDRGPLLPDHMREALRRYKKARTGGAVGFTGLSLEGREVAAPRLGGGGRRLFR